MANGLSISEFKGSTMTIDPDFALFLFEKWFVIKFYWIFFSISKKTSNYVWLEDRIPWTQFFKHVCLNFWRRLWKMSNFSTEPKIANFLPKITRFSLKSVKSKIWYFKKSFMMQGSCFSTHEKLYKRPISCHNHENCFWIWVKFFLKNHDLECHFQNLRPFILLSRITNISTMKFIQRALDSSGFLECFKYPQSSHQRSRKNLRVFEAFFLC